MLINLLIVLVIDLTTVLFTIQKKTRSVHVVHQFQNIIAYNQSEDIYCHIQIQIQVNISQV
ncbi:unnamed protein product [Trichobilharzia regenti]|nr:unnamed protein product [Trichobilharzia regenti]